MTDKELLENAAKAMGYKYMSSALWDGRDVVEYEWHPQNDDGQALRLAVKLKLLVNVTDFFTAATNGHEGLDEMLHGNDPYAATRRAIVRAAAEIGKNVS